LLDIEKQTISDRLYSVTAIFIYCTVLFQPSVTALILFYS